MRMIIKRESECKNTSQKGQVPKVRVWQSFGCALLTQSDAPFPLFRQSVHSFDKNGPTNPCFDNRDLFDKSCLPDTCMASDREKKANDAEKEKKDVEHEQMLEQVHQLELEKNYEADEEFDESKE